jgi:dienelactone hydrolase
MRTALAVAVVAACIVGANGQPLAGTSQLTWAGELDVRMMDGAHRFVEREIAQSIEARQRHWRRDSSSASAYESSIAANRKRFVEKIGAVDPLGLVSLERFSTDVTPAQLAETKSYRVFQVRWTVLDGVHGEGLLLEPLAPPSAAVVAIPDASQTPEESAGLISSVSPELQYARMLAAAGCAVLVPTLVSLDATWSGRPDIKMTDQPHREWIYRQAFHMGRHIIGYEVQKVRAAAEWLRKQYPNAKVGVAGYGEGGLIAFYAAAADPQISGVLVSGYFDSRQRVWSEPIYRNVWGLLEEFGDAEIATLIAPRALVVQTAQPHLFKSNKGNIEPLSTDGVRAEFARIDKLLPAGFQRRTLAGTSSDAVAKLLELFGVRVAAQPQGTFKARPHVPDAVTRQARQVKELETHVQMLVRESERTRANFFLLKVAPYLDDGPWSTKLKHPTVDPQPFIAGAKPYREYFANEVMGRFDEPMMSPNARTRKVYDTSNFIGYDVVLDVYPDVFAWGVLLVPKNIAHGEKRPVVVCQHGRQGLPKDVIEKPGEPYNQFAAKLADQGYVVFAPHNLYRGEDRYRWLSRKANGIKASLFSFIVAQHDQILRWLETLPFVDGSRMAFYGLSYGGETAVRVPAILEKYALSICSGDFNNWTRKVAATDEKFTFMYTIEWEMPYFNLGSTFDYSEMTYLIVPRPFMVERGHHDMVGRDRWVDYEYAKTRWVYTQLGMPDRTEIEHFNGGHAINGQGTFRFLSKHLGWPTTAR